MTKADRAALCASPEDFERMALQPKVEHLGKILDVLNDRIERQGVDRVREYAEAVLPLKQKIDAIHAELNPEATAA